MTSPRPWNRYKMKQMLQRMAAHCAPPSPGTLRAMVPGVLCGWGCAGLLALGHPWLAGALALAAAVVAGGWWKPSFWAESWRGRGWVLPSLVLGVILAAVMLLEPIADAWYAAWYWPVYKGLALGLVLGVLAGPPLVCALRRMAQKARAARSEERPPFPGLWFFLAVLLPLVVYWARVFPYESSFDLEYQLEMLRGEIPLNDVHTLAHTLLLGMLGGQPGLLVAVQLLALAGLLTAFAAWFYRRGMGLFALAACLCGGCLGPVVGQAAASPIKDMPAALCTGVVLYYIMRLLAEDLRLTWPHRIAFGAALAFTGLFRHNGLVLVLAAGLWLLARGIYRRRKCLLAAVAVCAVCILLVDGVAAPLLNVQHPANGFAVQVYATGIVAVDQRGGEITDEQRRRMEELLPMDYVAQCLENPDTAHFTRAQRLCWTRDLGSYTPSEREQQFVPLLEDSAGVNDVFNNLFILAAGQNKAELLRLYLELFLQNPWLCTTELLRNNTNVWRLDRGLGPFSHVFYLAAVALAFFCGSGRGMLRRWPALLPLACNIASVIVAASTNEIRYLLPTFLLAVPCALFFALEAGGADHQTKGVSEPCR